jgi:hypothetical protein
MDLFGRVALILVRPYIIDRQSSPVKVTEKRKNGRDLAALKLQVQRQDDSVGNSLNAADSSMQKRQPMVTWYIALSPMITLWLIGATAMHVRLVYGQWPTDAVDHAPTTLLALNILVFQIACLFVFLAGPTWVILLFCPSLRRNFCSHVLQAVSLAIGVIEFFSVPMLVDPKYVTWWLD